MAQASLEFSAAAAARFLTSRVFQAFQAAGWALRRILTDQGNEHSGAFDKACAERHIRHTLTGPRHAWINGFAERLQRTILSELWRIEFRRRFFTYIATMQTALDRYLDFYYHRRSQQGYRTQGRTSGENFFTRGGKREKRQRSQSVNTYPVEYTLGSARQGT